MNVTEISRRADALHRGPETRRMLCERMARLEDLCADAVQMATDTSDHYSEEAMDDLLARAREMRVVR